ncbi:Arginase, hepatic [Folsomia candida]|uniref:Arginase, hepatic n=1 Tax=Folsomia candida TaxID=158441 RepID=A0A226EUE9_FOLCA|nr:Arginase, hepatic [Folsomia candida]
MSKLRNNYILAFLTSYLIATVNSAAFVKKGPKEMLVGLQGLPFGRGNPRPGTETGPMYLRNGGIIEYLKDEAGVDVKDYGDMIFDVGPRVRTPVGNETKEMAEGVWNIVDVAKAAKKISDQTEAIAKDGRIVLSVGGDHSITIGTINGISNVHPNVAILYLDAHADINTVKTSPSGNLHGMTIPFAVKELSPDMKTPEMKDFDFIQPRVAAENVAHIGLRSVDPGETYVIRTVAAEAVGTCGDINIVGCWGGMGLYKMGR